MSNNGRGVVRRNKNKVRKERMAPLTEEDLEEIESLISLTEKKVQYLENTAVGYLEEELRILTSTPGNFSEVARILKILKDYQGSKKNNAAVRSNAPESVKSWSLDD